METADQEKPQQVEHGGAFVVDKPHLGRDRVRKTSLRTIACFEAAKGALVLLAGFGALALLHRDAQEIAEEIVRMFHLNPARHLPHVFIELSSRVNDSKLWFFAFSAFAYSLVRFAEAYGLWLARDWAEWFALLSGGLYLPVEMWEIMRRVTPIRIGVFVVNLLIVGYLAGLRWQMHRAKVASRHEGEGGAG